MAVAGSTGEADGVGVREGVGDGVDTAVAVGLGVGTAVAVGLGGVADAAVGSGPGDGNEAAVAVPAGTVSCVLFPAGLGAAVGEGCTRWVSNAAFVALGVRVGVGLGLTVAGAIAARVCVGETPPVDAAGEPRGVRAVTGSPCASGLEDGGLTQAPRATKTTPKHSSGARKPRRGRPRANGCTSERGGQNAD
ncbi:MAG: hypothetical protein IH862_08600 [Chloroflexi bacterium]|nr:hypothetical protein [Chloroflexota bacterium]